MSLEMKYDNRNIIMLSIYIAHSFDIVDGLINVLFGKGKESIDFSELHFSDILIKNDHFFCKYKMSKCMHIF